MKKLPLCPCHGPLSCFGGSETSLCREEMMTNIERLILNNQNALLKALKMLLIGEDEEPSDEQIEDFISSIENSITLTEAELSKN